MSFTSLGQSLTGGAFDTAANIAGFERKMQKLEFDEKQKALDDITRENARKYQLTYNQLLKYQKLANQRAKAMQKLKAEQNKLIVGHKYKASTEELTGFGVGVDYEL